MVLVGEIYPEYIKIKKKFMNWYFKEYSEVFKLNEKNGKKII
jgi:hypothetical protein